MERAKSIIIFFIVISIIIFVAAQGVARFKNGRISFFSALASIIKFDIPVPR